MLKSFSKITSVRSGFLTGLLLVGLGLALGGITLLNTARSQHATAQPVQSALKSNVQPKDTSIPLVSGSPIRIQIPSLGIDLKVVPGNYYPASKSWTLSLNDAQYGTMTAPANNQGGDTFIYAHYRKGVFLALPKIQIGALATITTDNGHTFDYTFRSSEITTPDDTSLFTYTGKPILVLQTCTGAWYQNRQLFVFDLTKVD